jgi:hypothetical protein
MTISTLDGVVAGFKQTQYFAKKSAAGVTTRVLSFMPAEGIPGKSVVPTSGLNGGGALLTSYPGQIPFTNPSGSDKSYLARFSVAGREKIGLILCDRIWHNSGFDVTLGNTTQSFTVGGTPCPDFTRDINNGTVSAKYGEGVYVGMEYYAPMNSATTITVTYTNSDGVSGKTGTIGSLNTSMTTGNFEIMGLAAGDTGVRSIQSALISTAAASGSVSFVAFRPIALIGLQIGNTSSAIDALTSGFPELYNNTVPFLLAGSESAGPSIQGTFAVTQG